MEQIITNSSGRSLLEPPPESRMGIQHCGWFLSGPESLCSSAGGGGSFPYGPLTSHPHGYKHHYPPRHTPYPTPYLTPHPHSAVSLSEGLQVFSGSPDGWSSSSPPRPSTSHQLDNSSPPAPPPNSSQYPCLWTVGCSDVSPTHSPCSVLHGPINSESLMQPANQERVGSLGWPHSSAHSFRGL